MTDRPANSPVARAASVALVDLVLVLVFAGIGRASHEEGLSAAGLARTAGPFVVGWLAGWVLVALVPATRHRPRSLPAGVLVWVATVVVGMLVRGGLVGDGVQTSFVVVTTIVLAVFLLGWRALALLVTRGRARSQAVVT